MKIWLIKEHDIEHCETLAVCTTYELAVKMVEALPKPDKYGSYEICEYETDILAREPFFS